MPGRAARRFAALLLPVLLAREARGQFFRDLHHMINPGGLTATLTGRSPEELAQAAGQAFKDHAGTATPSDLADKLKLDGNALLSPETAESLRGQAISAFGDLAGRTDMNVSAGDHRQVVAQVMQAASDALQRSAGVVANASAADVQGALQDAGSNSLAQPELKSPWEAIQGTSPEQLAKSFLDASPKVADALNKTSLEIADVLRQKTPEAAALLNKTGHEVAAALAADPSLRGTGGHITARSSDDTAAAGQEGGAVEGSTFGPLSGALLLILAVSAVFLVVKRYSGPRQRSPMLLSDALDMTTHGSSPARAPRLQPPSQEPLFTQF